MKTLMVPSPISLAQAAETLRTLSPNRPELARLSRSGTTHPLGKCDACLDVPMPAAMRDDLSAVARLSGKTAAEMARTLLSDWLYGRTIQLKQIVER